MLSRIYPQAQDQKTVRTKYRDGKRIKNRDGCQELKLFLHCSKTGVIESEETQVMLADPNTRILLLFIHTHTHMHKHMLYWGLHANGSHFCAFVFSGEKKHITVENKI